MKKVIIPVAILTAILALGAVLGCTVVKGNDVSANVYETSVETTVDDSRDADGELYYGTSDYPEGRRAEMLAQWEALNN